MLCASASQKARRLKRRRLPAEGGSRYLVRTFCPRLLNDCMELWWMKTRLEASENMMLAPVEHLPSALWVSAGFQPPPLRGILLSESALTRDTARRWQRLQPLRRWYETGCCRPSTARAMWVYPLVSKWSTGGSEADSGVKSTPTAHRGVNIVGAVNMWRVNVCLLIS